MSITVHVTGKGGGPPNLGKIMGDIGDSGRRNVFKAIAIGAYAVQGEARKLITDRDKSGKTYTSSKKSPKVHQASAPGEAPANWTGKLRMGVKVYTDEAQTTAYVAASAIEDGHDYAPNMELGTDDGRIAPRPFLRPAFNKFRSIINQSIKAAIKAAKKG